MTGDRFAQLHVDLVGVTADEWCDMVIRSLESPLVDGHLLPEFASENVQSHTTRVVSEEMLQAAYKLYRVIKSETFKLDKPITPKTRILDFGCGWGRIARFFLKDVPPSNLFGVEVVGALVEACKSTISQTQFQQIKQKGELPFADGSFDIVFANSVFSHLDEDLHIRWITEIDRVLAPGGTAAITVVSGDTLDRWLAAGTDRTKWVKETVGDEALARQRLANGELVWCHTSRAGELEGYGLAITPMAWLRKNWPSSLEIALVRKDYGQDVILAEKK